MTTGALTAGLVASLFDAAIDDAAWKDLGNTVANYMSVDRAAVVVVRDDQYVEQSTTKATEALFEVHARVQHLDPWLKRPMPPERDPIVLGSELYPEELLVQSRFYRDYAEKVGMFRPLIGDFSLGLGNWLAVGMDRSFATTHLDVADKARLAELSPFLVRAMQLRNRLRTAEASSAIGWALVNAWTFGAIVTDRSGRVIVANSAAEPLAQLVGLQLGSRNRPLSAKRNEDTTRLHAKIASAAEGGSGGTLVLVDGSPPARLLLLVTPMPSYISTQSGLVLVTIGDAAGRSFDGATLQEMFGLSGSQAALATAIADGKSLASFASERGVGITTLRSHLEQIFERTGVRSQRDLVKLLGRIPPMKSLS